MRGFVAAVAVGAVLTVAAAGAAGSLHIVTPSSPGEPVRLTGFHDDYLSTLLSLDADALERILSVYVEADGDIPPVFGDHMVVEDALLFTPRFPWMPGMSYRVVGRVGGQHVEQRFEIPVPDSPRRAAVVRVYPTADTLPANVLRFYVYFSDPMRDGDGFDNAWLEDADGNRIENGFVETVPELWDAGMQRLTLICHPGRIKRGLEMSDAPGAELRVGETYRLVISDKMRSATGEGLAERHEKVFRVVAADRVSPRPEDWTLRVPEAGSPDPLAIALNEPLDHAILPRHIAIETADGEAVEGTLSVTRGETLALFAPLVEWVAGNYVLVVHPSLEDLAGNRVDVPFDRTQAPDPSASEPRIIAFSIGDR